MIACGHVGRRLLELLEPFHCEVLVYDPHAPAVLAEIYELTLTSLDNVMSSSDVVICLAPLTSETRGLIGREQVEAMRAGTVFVNVSRGPVVQTAPLVERLERGDIIACLDVFDPEPIPMDHVVRRTAERLPDTAHRWRHGSQRAAVLRLHGRRGAPSPRGAPAAPRADSARAELATHDRGL